MKKSMKKLEPKSHFVVMIKPEEPIVMCERHAREFERLMIDIGVPHTILELDDAEAAAAQCHVCDLVQIQMKPTIILPN